MDYLFDPPYLLLPKWTSLGLPRQLLYSQVGKRFQIEIIRVSEPNPQHEGVDLRVPIQTKVLSVDEKALLD